MAAASVPYPACYPVSSASAPGSRVSPGLLFGLVRVLDALAISSASLVAAAAAGPMTTVSASAAILPAGLAAGLAVACFQAAGLYRQAEFAKVSRQIARLGILTAMTFAVIWAGAKLCNPGLAAAYPWMPAASLSFGLTVLGRAGCAAFAHRLWRAGRLNRRAAIYGSGEISAATVAALEADLDSDVRIVAVFDDRGDARNAGLVGGYPCLGTSDDLVAFARQTRVDLVILALPLQAERRLTAIIKRLRVLPVAIKMPASATPLRLATRAYSHAGSIALIDVMDLPMSDWELAAKRALDVGVSLLALLALAPLMAAIAVAVRLESRGPALFRQTRYGYNNQPVTVWKFRSMFTGACDTQAAKLVTRDDARVTRLGRLLRKSSLDELPQLFNVLLGDLSLVGPRPHAMAAKAADRLYDDVVEGYGARHRVKPGITGWAQINGWRGETDTEDKIAARVACDLAYIENWSLWLDLYILAATPLALFDTKAAY